jgi:hypothetical protein
VDEVKGSHGFPKWQREQEFRMAGGLEADDEAISRCANRASRELIVAYKSKILCPV